MSKSVMRTRPAGVQSWPAAGFLQRKCACGAHTAAGACAECGQRPINLRRKAPQPGRTDAVPAIVHEVLQAPGRPLEPATRAVMEPHLGHDFSSVLLHTDAKANESARAVHASAYTVGRNIVFGAGQYAPATQAGKQLLAHELTHVVQQRFAPAPAAHGLALGDPGDAFEAQATQAERAIAPAASPLPAKHGGGPGAAAPLLQRQPSGALPPLFPPLHLSAASVDIDAAESVSAANPNLIKLAASFKALAPANPGAYIDLSGYLNAAAQMSEAALAQERARMRARLNAVGAALETLGVPSAAVQIDSSPYPSSTSGGKISVRLFKEKQAAGPAPFSIPGPGPGPGVKPVPPNTATGPSLSELLSFKFKAGAVEFSAELPKSVSAKLPAAIGIAKSLSFELKAEASGTFSFSVALDGLPHIRVIAKAQLNVDKDKGSSGGAGLEIQATRTVCSADNPEVLKAKINESGEKLQKAMKELGAAAPDERLSKLVDIGSAIGNMVDAVNKSKTACKQVPAASFGLGVQGPLKPSDSALNDPDPTKRPATFFGGTFTVPF